MSADLNTSFYDFVSPFEDRIRVIEADLRKNCVAQAAPIAAYTVFAAISSGDKRAKIISVSGPDFEAVWHAYRQKMEVVLCDYNPDNTWIRVDHVVEARATTVAALKDILSRTKRNYFRYGIALDPEFEVAFTEQELNANAVLYGGGTIHHAIINQGNFSKYAAARYPAKVIAPLDDAQVVYLFRTAGLFIDEMGRPHTLVDHGRDSGRRLVENLDDKPLFDIIENSSSYLAKEVDEKGRFTYGYHACFDRKINAYNVLRHASTTYSMIEAWEQTRSDVLKQAIDRSLSYLIENHIKHVTQPDGGSIAHLVEEDGEIKLGGNAVAILAFTKYIKVAGDDTYLAIAESLASGICSMQYPETGAFVHVLNYPDLSVKSQFRIVYYDGEAAFALMRLYELTKDSRWIETVERAFDYFIEQQHWKHHDHWLAYCVNELSIHRPCERYFDFALKNIENYLGFVENRITTFPTLLELMMATRAVISRISEHPAYHHLLDTVDLAHFERALHARARYLLNGYFWPEMAMFYANPNRIVHSFFIRHHAFRVRIDDVEHYLSGLVAYRKYLKEKTKFKELVVSQSLRRPARRVEKDVGYMNKDDFVWDSDAVVEATGGVWLNEPKEGWRSPAVCTYLPAMRDGAMVVIRSEEGEVGVPSHQIARLKNAGALMVTDPTLCSQADMPVLHVNDSKQAVLAMGRYARNQMKGKVIGVTGSAGKTTMVALVSHMLAEFGTVSSTQFNANLPIGVAWNLASMPWNSDFVALELAIGRMAVSSHLARPNIAVVTNILPAHLGTTSTVADIAKTKSAIFSGMDEGDIAILNCDMMEWDIVHAAAAAKKLKIVTYGMCKKCDFRLAAYDSGSQRVYVEHEGEEITYQIGAGGQHSAVNSLVVLAILKELGLPFEEALPRFEKFAALPGRGEVVKLTLDGKNIQLIDDAYNANPGSMKAALQHLSGQRGNRRIALLGEMLDLGEEATSYHTALAAIVNASDITKVYAIGEIYSDFWELLAPIKRGALLTDRTAANERLISELEEGDVVLIKGSHGSNMHVTVTELKQMSAPAQ